MRATRAFIGVVLTAVLLCTPVIGQERPRPQVEPLKEIAVPQVKSAVLDNGLRILVIEHHEQPVVFLDMVILAGSTADPVGKEGTAMLTAAMLREGTEKYSSDEFSRRIDFIGGQLGGDASLEYSDVSCAVLTDHLDTAFELFGEMILRPAFPREDLQGIKQRVLSGMQFQYSDPAFVAGNLLGIALYGSHPYARQTGGTGASIGKIVPEDLKAFHAAWYQPQIATLIVAGDVRTDDIVERAKTIFSAWPKGEAARTVPAAAAPIEGRQIVVANIPTAVQAQIRFGVLTVPAQSGDLAALNVVSQVLGGSPSARLFKALRQEKGLTYTAQSGVSRRLVSGPMSMTTFTRNDKVGESVATLFGEIDKLRAEPPGEEEMRLAKISLLGGFSMTNETPAGMAGVVGNTIALGGEVEKLGSVFERINGVTAADVQRAAQRYLDTANGVLVVVGKVDDFRDALKAFGEIREFTVDGKEKPKAQ